MKKPAAMKKKYFTVTSNPVKESLKSRGKPSNIKKYQTKKGESRIRLEQKQKMADTVIEKQNTKTISNGINWEILKQNNINQHTQWKEQENEDRYNKSTVGMPGLLEDDQLEESAFDTIDTDKPATVIVNDKIIEKDASEMTLKR
jgi:hypothetical protein